MRLLNISFLLAAVLSATVARGEYVSFPSVETADFPAHNEFFLDHFCRLGMRSDGSLACVATEFQLAKGFAADTLIRGGAPAPQGVAFLKKIGVGLIVDLRSPAEDRMQTERKAAAAMGISYVNLPLQMDAGSIEKNGEFVSEGMAAVVEFKKTHPQTPVYVHCLRGEDRTGLMIAAYRTLVEHAEPASVEHEMTRHYFNWHYEGLSGAWRKIRQMH